MLAGRDAIATVAVKDLKVAAKFYEGALGLKRTEKQQTGTLSYKCGNSTLFVYESQFAGTNKATAVTWIVGDELEETVKALKAKRVVFEHYDFPGTTRTGDVHLAKGVRVAWFTDPDGNIHSLVNG